MYITMIPAGLSCGIFFVNGIQQQNADVLIVEGCIVFFQFEIVCLETWSILAQFF